MAGQLVWHGTLLATSARIVGQRANIAPGSDAPGSGRDGARPIPIALGDTLAAVEVEPQFIDAELAEMNDGQWAKTASRSVLGVMNEFSFLANESRRRHDFDPIGLALWLVQTPCGPLYGRHIGPDRELAAAVES